MSEGAGIAAIVIENTGNTAVSAVVRYGTCTQIINKAILIFNSRKMEKNHGRLDKKNAFSKVSCMKVSDQTTSDTLWKILLHVMQPVRTKP